MMSFLASHIIPGSDSNDWRTQQFDLGKSYGFVWLKDQPNPYQSIHTYIPFSSVKSIFIQLTAR